MDAPQGQYIAIDLKSFYASVECVERGLDPLDTHLVVADGSRTEKTICLAVSPALKSYGIGGRARLFEVVQRVGAANRQRLDRLADQRFRRKSTSAAELAQHPDWELDYIVATPRMAYYMDYSCRIFDIYCSYISPDDIHVYSIDEVFMDVTHYLEAYHATAHELARRIIGDVLRQTGITATAGIGTNLYLCKVAMDIVAKHTPPDKDGVRIAELDETSYRQRLWNHRPLTDFWRVGHGIAQRLAKHGITTMGQVARQSVRNEELLYRMFGVNAELLIDHAWGWEPCTMAEIKGYRPTASSLSSGQVLMRPYKADEAALIVREMTDLLALDLVDKKLVTDQLVLHLGYDNTPVKGYEGPIVADWYGRPTPKPAHGSINLPGATASTALLLKAAMELFQHIVNPDLMVRRIYVVAAHVFPEEKAIGIQLGLFEEMPVDLEKERRQQEAILEIRRRFGKNAILKGMNFEEGATTRERNNQIGGHKA